LLEIKELLPMKKFFFPLLAITFIVNSCKKEEPEINTVSTERKSFLIYFTGTWCPPCGGFGVPVYVEALEKYPYKLCALSLHCDASTTVTDPFTLQPTFNNLFFTVYNQSGVPRFVMDNVPFYPDSDELSDRMDSVSKLTPPVCGIGIAKTIVGNTMTIKTKTVFFKEASGTFNQAVYVTESNLYADQANSTEDYHDYVLRAAVDNDKGTGSFLTAGTLKKGTVYDKSYTYSIPSNFVQDNLNVIVVVYQVDANNKPIAVINANKI
jgi:hypothetical protein